MSFIANVRLPYGWEKTIEALDVPDYNAWRNGALSIRDKWKESPDGAPEKRIPDIGYTREFIMDGEEVESWTKAGVVLEMSRVKGLASNARELPATIYQISVANVGLMQVQCVEVLDNCCTNELQAWLDRGWRILAVCPPNDTRRPSYVVGHVDKEPHR